MLLVFLLWLFICVLIGITHPELVKTILFITWVVMVAGVAGSMLYALASLMFR